MFLSIQGTHCSRDGARFRTPSKDLRQHIKIPDARCYIHVDYFPNLRDIGFEKSQKEKKITPVS